MNYEKYGMPLDPDSEADEFCQVCQDVGHRTRPNCQPPPSDDLLWPPEYDLDEDEEEDEEFEESEGEGEPFCWVCGDDHVPTEACLERRD